MKKHINIIMVAMLMALSFNTPGAEGDFIDPNLQVIKFNLWATVCPNNQADLVTVWVPWRTRALGFLMGNEPQGSRPVSNNHGWGLAISLRQSFRDSADVARRTQSFH